MHRVAGRFVPRILTADQKQQRFDVYTELRQLASDDETFLSRVITVDESVVKFIYKIFICLTENLKYRQPFDHPSFSNNALHAAAEKQYP
jgi:hypothetical protein